MCRDYRHGHKAKGHLTPAVQSTSFRRNHYTYLVNDIRQGHQPGQRLYIIKA